MSAPSGHPDPPDPPARPGRARERAQQDSTNSVGHELRSPLTSVLGYAQLLGAGSLTAEQHRYVDVISRSGHRLLRLINELLVSVELSAGQLGIDRKEVDLAGVSRRCGDELGPTALAAGLSLTVEAPGPVPVSGDPELLAQAITGLLDNAIKLTSRGGAVTIRVGAGDGMAREAVVEVVDTGVGMGPDELGRLTERFYRAGGATRRRAGYLELGLPVAQGIIDAHGGTLAVDSAPGEGTRVTVTLPALSPTARS